MYPVNPVILSAFESGSFFRCVELGDRKWTKLGEFNPRLDPLHMPGVVCAKRLKEIAAKMLD